MTKSRSDSCIYIVISAVFTGAIAQYALPYIIPEVEPLWITIVAAMLGMIFAAGLLWIQDNSKKRKYRGQV
jgi:hypothetical protein